MSTHDPDVLALLRTIESKTARAIATDRLVRQVGPIVASIHPTNETWWMSGAIPVSTERTGVEADDVAAAVGELRRWFAEHRRTFRLEVLEPLWPDLAGRLAAAGMTLESRMPIMLCAAGDLKPAAAPAGVTIEPVTADAPDAQIHDLLDVAHRGFADSLPACTADRIAEQRGSIGAGFYRCAIARVGGVPAASGTMTVPNDELVGIATLPEYRRRGIGAAVSHFLVRRHFELGAPLAWLSAADDAARRVYHRIGFRAVGDQLNFTDPR